MNYMEEYSSDRSVNSQYFEGYDDIKVHRVMLSDEPRMKFYKESIKSCLALHQGVVIDIGSGSGILSCWAALNNAKHVLSIEASSFMSSLQERILRDNSVIDRITIISRTCEEIIAGGVERFVEQYSQINECQGVSVIISEWMGFYLFHEGMLQSVLKFYQFCEHVNKYLEVEKKIELIPSHAALFVAPISLKPYYAQKYTSFWKDIHGVCMSAFAAAEIETIESEIESPLIDIVPSESLLHDGLLVWESNLAALDWTTLNKIVSVNTFDFSTTITSTCNNNNTKIISVDGFTIWFCVSYGDYVLNTSPLASPTHWKQTNLLLPYDVRSQELVSFTIPNIPITRNKEKERVLVKNETTEEPANEELQKTEVQPAEDVMNSFSKASDDCNENKLELTLTLSAVDEHLRCYTLTYEINEAKLEV